MFSNRFRRRKLNNSKLLIIFCIAMFFLGTSYASLSQKLELNGVVTVKSSSSGEDDDYFMNVNLDSEIIEILEPWSASNGSGYQTRVKFKVTNNNDFDATNWTTIIHIPGATIIDASPTNLTDWGIDQENNNLVFTNNDITQWTTKIAAGTSTPVHEFTVTVDDISSLKNMSIFSYTILDVFELQDFQYEIGSLVFNVAYTVTTRWDGKYVTSASISVTNNGVSTLNSLKFKINYNEGALENYDSVKSYSLKRKEATETYSTYEMYNYNSIPAGSTYTFGESQGSILDIVTTNKFRGFSISDVEYTFDGMSAASIQEGPVVMDEELIKDINKSNLIITNTTNSITTNTIKDITTNTITNDTTNTFSKEDNTIENTVTNQVISNNEVEKNAENEVNDSNIYDESISNTLTNIAENNIIE